MSRVRAALDAAGLVAKNFAGHIVSAEGQPQWQLGAGFKMH